MNTTRSTVVTAAFAAGAALVATGITYASAASAPEAPQAAQAAPAAVAAAPLGGSTGGKGVEGYEDGRIFINERSYSSHEGDCITVISGLGAKSLNIRNDSRKTVEVFRGVVCDNGAPIATVGPHSSSDGVHVRWTKGVKVKHGVVGSFRVVDHDYKD